MRPGKARKVIVQRYTESTNDFNEVIETWADFLTVWAEITPQTGTEVFRSDKETALRSAKFLLWYDSRILDTDRIVYESENYNITYRREIGFQNQLEILAEVRT